MHEHSNSVWNVYRFKLKYFFSKCSPSFGPFVSFNHIIYESFTAVNVENGFHRDKQSNGDEKSPRTKLWLNFSNLRHQQRESHNMQWTEEKQQHTYYTNNTPVAVNWQLLPLRRVNAHVKCQRVKIVYRTHIFFNIISINVRISSQCDAVHYIIKKKHFAWLVDTTFQSVVIKVS